LPVTLLLHVEEQPERPDGSFLARTDNFTIVVHPATSSLPWPDRLLTATGILDAFGGEIHLHNTNYTPTSAVDEQLFDHSDDQIAAWLIIQQETEIV